MSSTIRLDADRQQMAIDHLGLARAIGTGWARSTGLETEDMVGAANLGLCVAALRWKPELRVPFDWFAKSMIRFQLRQETRRSRSLTCLGGDELKLVADALDGEELPEVMEAFRSLAERDQEVLFRRVWLGERWKEIGRQLHMPTHAAWDLKKRSLARLRDAIQMRRLRGLAAGPRAHPRPVL